MYISNPDFVFAAMYQEPRFAAVSGFCKGSVCRRRFVGTVTSYKGVPRLLAGEVLVCYMSNPWGTVAKIQPGPIRPWWRATDRGSAPTPLRSGKGVSSTLSQRRPSADTRSPSQTSKNLNTLLSPQESVALSPNLPSLSL